MSDAVLNAYQLTPRGTTAGLKVDLGADSDVVVSGTHVYDGLAGGLASVEVKFAVINAGSSGQNTIVTAVSGKSIRLLSYGLVSTGTVNVEWRTGTTTPLSGAMNFVANGGISLASPTGLMQTTDGAALTMNLSAATAVDGHISYIEVD